MMHLIVVIAAGLLVTAVARGDIPRPDRPPNVEIRFENLAEHSDYDFYLKYGRTAGNPYAGLFLTRLTNAPSHRLEGTGDRLTPVYLLAMPRGQKPPSAPGFGHPDQYTWLEATPPGAMQALLQGHEGGGLAASHGRVLTYRIDIADGRMMARLTSPDPSSGPGAQTNWPIIAAAGAFSIGLTGAVVWAFRRTRQVRRTQAGDRPDQT